MKKIFFALLMFTVLISCKKDSVPNNNSNNSGTSVKNYVYLDANRILTINVPDTTHLQFLEIVIAQATDGSQKLDMGIVNYGDSILYHYTDGFYYDNYNNPDFNTGWSTELGGGKLWKVAGNSTTGIPAFSATTSSIYPSINQNVLNLNAVHDRNNPLTLHWNISVPADSVIIRVAQSVNNGIVLSSGYLAGATSSYTFTPSQLQTLPAGSVVLVRVDGYIKQTSRVSDTEFNVRNWSSTTTHIELQ